MDRYIEKTHPGCRLEKLEKAIGNGTASVVVVTSGLESQMKVGLGTMCQSP